jgi:hypothetical protein
MNFDRRSYVTAQDGKEVTVLMRVDQITALETLARLHEVSFAEMLWRALNVFLEHS